jgi:nucleoside-diphosphate-sugar epimerase
MAMLMRYYTTSIIGFLITTLMVGSTMALASPRKVVVTGAGGQTGQSLFRKLLTLKEEFEPLGLVRSEESKAKLIESGVPASQIAVVDVTDAAAVKAIAKDCAAFCICTSAKPSPTGELQPETGRPIFGFPNGSPELVDWMGQKNQIDACPAGAHVVVCSTMGGTDVNHPLNNLGRTVNEDGSISGGNIVKWKRKSEVYLMTQMTERKLHYTIVHPGGLLNEPGGERELIVGVDDTTTLTDAQTVPREDVAEVMLQALRYPEIYAGRSFDLRAKPVGDGSSTTNFVTLMESLKGQNCDYSLGETM